MSADRISTAKRCSRGFKLTLLATSVLAGSHGGALAQTQNAGSGQLEEIVVTAQKRSENLQDVPLSIQAFNGRKLAQLNATEFADYVKFLPNVSFETFAPSQTNIFIRGVSAGNDFNHSGPLPTVGVYLDEMPITTILGALDVHLYDIARVEVLAGPQGTLYGASSEAGTLRIITNEPDTDKFSAAYNLEFKQVANGGPGDVIEGYVNMPITDKVAIRLVGWEEVDGGYIDNVHGTVTFPTSGATMDNSNRVKDNYNDVTTFGGRAALKIDLDDDWTITPTMMAQDQRSHGVFGFDPKVGDLKVVHFFPENNHDYWAQAGLTIKGKIWDLDLVYSGGYFERWLDSNQDYTDYGFFYDSLTTYGQYYVDSNGKPINPAQRIIGYDKFTKQSHEIRISSPNEDRLRFVAGLFYEWQTHQISQDYLIDGLAPAISVPGWPNTIWLTRQKRVDRDMAAFGQATYDLTDQLSITGGVRVFEARNSLYGFFGYGSGFSSHTGQAGCFIFTPYQDAPCVDLQKSKEEVDATYKANISYKIDEDRMVYATASSGYRPPGINRNAQFPPYTSDRLYNYEIGWKTTWDNKQVRWNGALYWENWDNFQFSYLGPNGLTIVSNAGAATVKGLESDLSWSVDANLLLSGAISVSDGRLDDKFCGVPDASGNPTTNCPVPQAPADQVLPQVPLVKANATARYEFSIADSIDAFVQGSVIYQGRSTSDLRTVERGNTGMITAYTTADISGGVQWNDLSLELFIKNLWDERGEVYRYAECQAKICAGNVPGIGPGGRTYVVPIQPLTFGVKFGQKF